MISDPSQLAELIHRWGLRYRSDPEFRADLDLLAGVLREVGAVPTADCVTKDAGAVVPASARSEVPAPTLPPGVAAPPATPPAVPGSVPRAGREPIAGEASHDPTREPPRETPLSITAEDVEHLKRRILAPERPPITADGAPLVAPAWTAAADDDLSLVERRCRMKAEGSRWAAERVRRMVAGLDWRTEVEPQDHEIIRRARDIPECYLWMNTREGPVPADLSELEDVADAFEACGGALAVVRRILDGPDHRDRFERGLDLLAEAQSALRATIEHVDAAPDPDQKRIYFWLRGVAARESIFIRRHMKMDDPADPRRLHELTREIDALEAEVSEVSESARKRKAGINTIRYHARRIENGEGTAHDWRRIQESISELLDLGLPRSHPDLRNALLPLIDQVPDEVTLDPGPAGVFREVDRYLGTRVAAPEPADRVLTPEVVAVRGLLGGRSAVVIGGTRRPPSQEALRQALGLREVYWPDSREHQSIEPFATWIAKDDVAIVLLAIRWSSHSFGEVKTFCDRYDKPLVRLPRGYSPSQVAVEILNQASGALERGR